MVVDHGPIKYLISKIRYDDQESPKPNSNFLESYLRQHEENKPRLYLRRIQGLESLHSITDSGLNPIFKDDFKDFKDGVYIYDSIEEIPEKKDEDDFEIRSFVDSDDLETIRKYRNTNFIINGEQIGPRIIQKEKLSPCQRRNKRLQTEVQDMDVTHAADEDIELESEVVDESLEDIAMKRYEEMEQQVGRKVKVDTWKGKGVKRICLCNTKKYKVVKGKFGNKSVKIKLTVNRNTRNAAESKQKKKICLCNLAKKIIKTTAELTAVQNKDALSKTLNEVLDTLNLSDDMVPNEKDNVTVSSTKLVDPIDVEEIESVSEKKICVCKKRKKNVSLKIVRKTCEATVMVDAQTEIPDSMDEELNKLIENGNEYDEEDLKLSAEEDATNKNDDADEEQHQEKLERGNEDEIQSSVDGSQELQIVENEAKEVDQDKLDRKKSRKKRKRVCLCNKKVKNVAIKIMKTRASGWSVETENSTELKQGQNVEATELDESHVEAAAEETKNEDGLSKAKSMRKKRICLCEKQLKDVAIKIIRTTSDSSSKKHIHVVRRHRTNNLKSLKYRMKIERRKLDGEADLEISKLKWRKKKKKLCFCDFHLESIDEEIHTKEQIPEPIEKIDSIEKRQAGDTLESKEEIQFKGQVPGPIEKMDSIENKPEGDTIGSKTNESSLYEIYNPHKRIEDQSEPNLLSTQTTQSSLQEILKPSRGYVDGPEEQSESNVLFVKASENNKTEEQMQEAINKDHDLTKVAEKSNITDATSQTSISVRTVKEHSLQRILSSSSKAKKNDHSVANGSTLVKTGPTKHKTSCLCKDQNPKKILITRNNLSKLEFDKIRMQLKSGNKADVESTKKLKQKKKVCFCEDLLMKEILENEDDQSASSDELEANRSCQEIVSPRNTKQTIDKYSDGEKEGEIVIRRRYVAESSYGKDQDMQELINEMLKGTDNRLTKPHEFKEAGEMTNKLKKLPIVKCIKKQCKAIIKENRSIESEKLEIDASNEDAINDTRMKKKKKKKKNTETCRCDCNCPETTSSLIEVIDASELLSACNKEEFEMPDTRKCNDSVYKVLYASDLKPIIEESNEDEDKLHERNQNTIDDITEDQKKETCTGISNCYKDTICNRLSPMVLLDPIEQSTLSIASRLSEEMTLDQRTQTKERHYTKKHRNTSNNEALKRKSESSFVGLLDSDDDLSLNTDHVSNSANFELKSIIDELNQDLLNTKVSKKASKCNQMDSLNEDQDDGITIEQLHRKKPSLMSPDSHLETSKEKVCDGSYSTENYGNGKMNEIKQQALKASDARDSGCAIEESKELNQKSQTQDIKSTKRLSKGVSSHKISKQMETFCVAGHDFEKDKNFSKHSLSRFSEPCDHSISDTDPVSRTSSIKELKSAISHSKKGILDEEVLRKPKKKSFILNTITKCIADAERHIKKPFKRICSYTEDPVNKKASPINPLNLNKHSKSREVKKMNKLYVNSEKKSNREECRNLDNKRSGHNAQAKEISFGKDQSTAEITTSSATDDQQMQCSSKCKFEERTVSDETSSIASDNNNKVSDIKSDNKSNLARETSHTGTQTKKSTISTNHSIKDLTNGDIFDQKENSVCNRSSLAYSNEPSGSLTFTTELVSQMSDFTQQKSDTVPSISAKWSSISSKRTKYINAITENTDDKNQSKKLDKSCCSLIEDNDLTNTPLERSKQMRNVFYTAKPSELISEEYKSSHGRASDQQTQTTNKTLKAKETGTEMLNGGLEGEKQQICHKPSLIISLYPNKYSVHCTNKASETSDITVIKSKATRKSFSDQGTQSEEPNSIARLLTADLASDKLLSCNEESNKLNSNLTGEDSMLATELVCCREYTHGSRGEEESYSSENRKQRSLVREKCTSTILEESQLTKLRSTSYSCSEYPICKDSSLIVLLNPDKNSAYNIENMKKKHGTRTIKSIIKESSTQIIDCEAPDRVRKICRCRETKLCDKSSMTTPHGHLIDRIKKEQDTWDQDTQAKGTNVISTQFTTSFIDGSAKNRELCKSNYSSQNSEASLIIPLGLENNSLNAIEEVKKASKTTTIKQTRRKVQKYSLSNKLLNQNTQTKERYHIAKQSNKDCRIVHGKMITLPGSLGSDENTNLRNGYSYTGGLENSTEKSIMNKDICHVNRETKMRHTSVTQGTTNNEVLENNSTLEELEELFMYEEEMQWKSIAAKEANMSGKSKLKKLRSMSCSCSEYPISKGRSLIVLYSPDRNLTYDIKHMRRKHDKRKMKSVAIGSSTEISYGEIPNEKFNYGSKCGETKVCDRSLMTILYDVSAIAKHITEKVRDTCDLIVANAFANNEGTKSKQSEVISSHLTTHSIDGSGKSTEARRNHYKSQKVEIQNEPSLLVSLDPRNMEQVEKVSKTTMTKHTRRKVRRSRLKKGVSSQNTQTKENKNDEIIHGKKKSVPGPLDLNEIKIPITDYCNTEGLNTSSEESSEGIMDKTKMRHLDVTPNEDSTNSETLEKKNCDVCLDMIYKNGLGTHKSSMIEMKNICKHTDFKERKSTASQSGENTLMGIILGENSKAKEVSQRVKDKSDKATKRSKSKLETCNSAGDANYSIPSVTELLDFMQVRSKLTKSDSTDVVPVIPGDMKGMETTSEKVVQKMREANEKSIIEAKHEKISFVSPDGKISVMGNWKGNVAIECLNKRKPTF